MHARPNVLLQITKTTCVTNLRRHQNPPRSHPTRPILPRYRFIERNRPQINSRIPRKTHLNGNDHQNPSIKKRKNLPPHSLCLNLWSVCRNTCQQNHRNRHRIHGWLSLRNQKHLQKSRPNTSFEIKRIRCSKVTAILVKRIGKRVQLESQDLLHLDPRYHGQLLSPSTPNLPTHHRPHLIHLSFQRPSKHQKHRLISIEPHRLNNQKPINLQLNRYSYRSPSKSFRKISQSPRNFAQN